MYESQEQRQTPEEIKYEGASESEYDELDKEALRIEVLSYVEKGIPEELKRDTIFLKRAKETLEEDLQDYEKFPEESDERNKLESFYDEIKIANEVERFVQEPPRNEDQRKKQILESQKDLIADRIQNEIIELTPRMSEPNASITVGERKTDIGIRLVNLREALEDITMHRLEAGEPVTQAMPELFKPNDSETEDERKARIESQAAVALKMFEHVKPLYDIQSLGDKTKRFEAYLRAIPKEAVPEEISNYMEQQKQGAPARK